VTGERKEVLAAYAALEKLFQQTRYSAGDKTQILKLLETLDCSRATRASGRSSDAHGDSCSGGQSEARWRSLPAAEATGSAGWS
jgi:hypothetical protein